jgi:hypothetical protein
MGRKSRAIVVGGVVGVVGVVCRRGTGRCRRARDRWAGLVIRRGRSGEMGEMRGEGWSDWHVRGECRMNGVLGGDHGRKVRWSELVAR